MDLLIQMENGFRVSILVVHQRVLTVFILSCNVQCVS